MINFLDTLQQPKQAPSAQLKPVVQKQPQPQQPNLFQNVLSTAGNFLKGLTKNPVKTLENIPTPTQVVGNQVQKGVNTLVNKFAPNSTLQTITQGKLNQIPQAVKKDFNYANENAKKDMTIGKQSPEYVKNRAVGFIGSVDNGPFSSMFADTAPAEQKVAQTVAKDVKPVTPPPGSVPPKEDLVGRITQDVKKAVPVQKQQQELYSAELKQRSAKVAEIGQNLKGKEALIEQKRVLQGELAPKPAFEPIRGNYTPQEEETLFQMVENHPGLRPLEKVDAKDALDRLLNGENIQRAEIDKLQTVFGKQFGDIVINKATSKFGKVLQTGADVLNVPRALNSSFDLSASGRQGIFAIPSHPVAAVKSFVNQFKAAFSDKGYQQVMENIQKRPSFQVARDAGVAFTDTSGVLSGKEEAYMSNLAEKIPVIGRLIRASDRGYSAFLNDFRSQIFDGFYKNAQKLGQGNDANLLKQYAGLVNNMTGRGDLGILNRYAPILNGGFFSPRLIASRVQLMNPVYYARLQPAVRKEAMKSLVAFVGTGLGILGAANAAGAKVGNDPRSADFGKIVIGNTRYDIWGGFQQYAVLLTRLLTGQSVSTTTGKVNNYGVGYKPDNRLGAIGRFSDSKLAPVPSFGVDALRGTDQLGQPFNLQNQAYNRLTPFFIQDFQDAVKSQGLPVGALMSIPGFFGVGGNTYTTTQKKKVKIGPTVLR